MTSRGACQSVWRFLLRLVCCRRREGGGGVRLPSTEAHLVALLLGVILLLSSCGAPAPIVAVPTAVPTAVSTAVATVPPLPTAMSTPAATAAPTARPRPSPVALPTAGPSQPLLYELDGNLRSYDGVAARAVIEDGRSYQPLPSPDGHWVLFRRHEPPTRFLTSPFSLWLLDVQTGEERQVELSVIPTATEIIGDQIVRLPQLPYRAQWLPDSSAVLFNTAIDFSVVAPGGIVSSDDLWQIDPASGRVTNILFAVKRPALFTLSPDGQWALISRPGRIEAISLSGDQRQTLLNFSVVATYSEYSWLPEPYWLPGSTSIYVAIAPQDPEKSQVFNLYRLDLQKSRPELMGQVLGTPYAWSPSGASWSPDGARLAYVAHVGADWRVMSALADGSSAMQAAVGEHPEIWGWSPDAHTFFFWDKGALWAVDAVARPQARRLGELPAGATLLWRGSELYAVADGQLLQVALDGSGVEVVR